MHSPQINRQMSRHSYDGFFALRPGGLCPFGQNGQPLLQPTEWQHIGDQIDAAFICAQADFVNVHGDGKRFIVRADDIRTAFVELEAAIHRVRGEFDIVTARAETCVADEKLTAFLKLELIVHNAISYQRQA